MAEVNVTSGGVVRVSSSPTLVLDTVSTQPGIALIGRKEPVRAATVGNIALSGLQTIDGVVLVANDRVLVKNQTTGAQNGIYLAQLGAWVRSSDMDTSLEAVAGMDMIVQEGAANADTFWLLTTDAPIVLGTTALVFTEVSGGGSGGVSTEEPLTFAVDYNLVGAVDPPLGLVFTQQVDIDDFLAAAGTTAFKHLVAAYNSLPTLTSHAAVFNLAPGVHRPRPTETTFAWNCQHKQTTAAGSIQINGSPSSSYTNLHTALTITAVQIGLDDPFITFSGTPFVAQDLRGYFLVISTGQVAVIHSNDSSTIRLLDNLSPTPIPGTHTANVSRPSTILRNSLATSDTVKVATVNGLSVGCSSVSIVLPADPVGNPFAGLALLQDVWIQTLDVSTSQLGMQNGRSVTRRVLLDGKTYTSNGNMLQGTGINTTTFDRVIVMAQLAGGGSDASLTASEGTITLSLTRCLFWGGEDGFILNAQRMLFQSVVCDGLGTLAGSDVCEVRGLVDFRNISRGKINEFRNNATGSSCLVMYLGGRFNPSNRPELMFSAWSGVLVRVRGGTASAGAPFTVSGQPAGIKNGTGGANGNVAFEIVSAPPHGSRVYLDVNTTASGTAGDVRINGTVYSYAAILAASAVVDLNIDAVVTKAT